MYATELTAFLRSCRARLRPQEIGIRSYGGVRRVPGLRREELAESAGVSTDYYARLEQGRNHKISTGALDSIARSLRLTEVERRHLLPGLQHVLDTMVSAAAGADCRAFWERQVVREHTTGQYRLPHPELGLTRLAYRTLHLPEARGQALFADAGVRTWIPAPGSRCALPETPARWSWWSGGVGTSGLMLMSPQFEVVVSQLPLG